MSKEREDKRRGSEQSESTGGAEVMGEKRGGCGKVGGAEVKGKRGAEVERKRGAEMKRWEGRI